MKRLYPLFIWARQLKESPGLSMILVGALVLGIVVVRAFWPAQQKNNLLPSGFKLTHPPFDFDERIFYEGVNQATEENGSFTTKILGGVVPHHTLVSYLIADFFARLATQEPKTIILLGPNHEEMGSYQVLTSTYGWETPFGILGVNQQIIDTLSQKDLVRVDDKSLANEFSVAALAPYLKYYLPEVEIVPLIFKSNFDLNDLSALGGVLAQMLNEKTVLIASIDFSHYLTNQEAKEKDEVTFAAIKNFDFAKILSFDNDHLDSPAALAVLLWALKEKDRTDIEEIYHLNSGELQNNEAIPTTSYFVLTFS